MAEKKAKKKEVVVNGDSIFAQYGVHAMKLSPNYAGKTVDEIIGLTSGILNLPDAVATVINGEVVESTTQKVKKGDKIEFVKAAGRKG